MKVCTFPMDHYSEMVYRCQGYSGKWSYSADPGNIRGDP